MIDAISATATVMFVAFVVTVILFTVKRARRGDLTIDTIPDVQLRAMLSLEMVRRSGLRNEGMELTRWTFVAPVDWLSEEGELIEWSIQSSDAKIEALEKELERREKGE